MYKKKRKKKEHSSGSLSWQRSWKTLYCSSVKQPVLPLVTDCNLLKSVFTSKVRLEVFTGPLRTKTKTEVRPEQVRVQNYDKCLGHGPGLIQTR